MAQQPELEPDEGEEEERPRRRPPAPRDLDDACQTLQASQMMWTKFGIAAILGLASAVVYLAVRKGSRPIASVDPEAELGAIPAVPWPQPAALPPAPAPMAAPMPQAAPQAARRPPAPPRVTGNVITQSYRLPRLGDKERTAPRVAQATDVPYDVVLRTVGPAGTWATFAYSSTELDMANGGSYPVGQTLTIPAGQWQPIRLQPHEVLYAKGNVDNVTISLTLTEVIG